jgi:hypothetical protein
MVNANAGGGQFRKEFLVRVSVSLTQRQPQRCFSFTMLLTLDRLFVDEPPERHELAQRLQLRCWVRQFEAGC